MGSDQCEYHMFLLKRLSANQPKKPDAGRKLSCTDLRFSQVAKTFCTCFFKRKKISGSKNSITSNNRHKIHKQYTMKIYALTLNSLALNAESIIITTIVALLCRSLEINVEHVSEKIS